MTNTTNKIMALKFEMLSDDEITKFAKNLAGFEKILSKLTTDEIASLLERLDDLIACLPSNKVYSNLMQLKMMVLEEVRLREEIEIS